MNIEEILQKLDEIHQVEEVEPFLLEQMEEAKVSLDANRIKSLNMLLRPRS